MVFQKTSVSKNREFSMSNVVHKFQGLSLKTKINAKNIIYIFEQALD